MRRNTPSGPRGFTLIELMVTLSVLVVLTLIAAPSFSEYRRSSELASGTNALLAAINAARTEAMKRAVNAGAAPLSGSNWNSGVRVFVDKNMNGVFDADDIELTRFVDTDAAGSVSTLPGPLSISSSNSSGSYVGFSASGYLDTTNTVATTLSITRTDDAASGKDISTTTRRIIIALTGQVRSCRPANANDSTCKASATS